MTPVHATLPIGAALPWDYFAPGTSTMNGKVAYSPWAVAFYGGASYRFERSGLGEPWIRVS